MSLDIAATADNYEARGALIGPLVRFAKRRSSRRTVTMTETDDGGVDRAMADLLVLVGSQRDMDAFETLFRHFAPRVRAYMSRGGGRTNADELMQETMAAVWRKAALYDPAKGAAAAWVFAIARNQRIDAFRRDRRPEFDPNDPAFVPDADPPADQQYEQLEAAAQLRRALVTLPAEQKEVLQLSFFEGQTHSAIADRLKLPMGTVKSRVRLALAKLRAVIDEEGGRS